MNMNPEPKLKVDRTGIIIWTLFGCLFIYSGVYKYGLLLAYLKVAGFLYLLLAGLIFYLSIEMQERYAAWRRHGFVTTTINCLVFFGSIYLFLFVQPDKLIIAFFLGIPIEALYPCSNQPLDPESELIAREIFRLKQIDKFEGDYCN
jgi:hypothetical protein